ncbi:MAG TPA: TrmH family RNA methyltransferase [Candidatus Ozemobacteraceae bacterium]|nr:TrmH family RNA methyltransferase [Candidatus Ozemobacteraceae bacterium]
MPSPRRIHRLATSLHNRQTDIIVALDGVHDPHNVSAILRSSDAVGIDRVIWRPDPEAKWVNPEVTRGSERWVALEDCPDFLGELRGLKTAGFRIAATHLAHDAVDFRTPDWTKPWVIVMGNEHRGCTDELLELADENIFLPMYGLVQSLNVSVATAVTLYEVQRQRQLAGMYGKTRSREHVEHMFHRWGLGIEGFTVEELLTFPEGDLPSETTAHQDGRKVPRRRKRAAVES